MCPTPCKADPCKGHQPLCKGGLCSTDTPPVALAPGVLDDLSQAGQLLLDDARVSQYFHETQRPERVPLVVAWEPGMPQPRWTKFGRPVQIFEGLPAKQPYLVPTLVSVEAQKATFNFWYEPEGTLFVGELIKRDGRWAVGSIQVHERSR